MTNTDLHKPSLSNSGGEPSQFSSNDFSGGNVELLMTRIKAALDTLRPKLGDAFFGQVFLKATMLMSTPPDPATGGTALAIELMAENLSQPIKLFLAFYDTRSRDALLNVIAKEGDWQKGTLFKDIAAKPGFKLIVTPLGAALKPKLPKASKRMARPPLESESTTVSPSQKKKSTKHTRQSAQTHAPADTVLQSSKGPSSSSGT